MRAVAAVVAAGVVAFGFLLVAPTSLGGGATWVSTTGTSMEPDIHSGDLVIARPARTYREGDVVAYRSQTLGGTVVLHRIIGEGPAGLITKGDNNNWVDPDRPSQRQLLGQQLVHIPAGGIWLDRLTHPAALGVLTVALLAGGTATGISRRHRRRRKSTTMSQHATSRIRRAASWPRPVRNTAAIGAVAGSLGLLVGAVSWAQPTTELRSAAAPSERTMTFSYHAEVPPSSPAYDSGRVVAPAPIFRRVTDELDLRYSYRGEPGTVTVAAELSAANGWHSQMPLQQPIGFEDRDYTGIVHLDTEQLAARARAAGDAIGTAIEQLEVAVVATITTESGEVFAPKLTFILTPDQLTLADGASALTVTDTASTDRDTQAGNTVGIDRYQVPVSVLRTASTGLLLAGLIAVCIALVAARRSTTGEAAAIKRRYATMLLHVEPVISPPGRPVVDVTDFAALARLAERYDLLVMHWTRSDVETFIVHDDGITYRYRTSTATSTATGAGTGTRHSSAGAPPTSTTSSPNP